MEQKLNTLKRTLEKLDEQDAKLAEQRKMTLLCTWRTILKRPLTSIIGYLSLLDEAPDMPVDQKQSMCISRWTKRIDSNS